MMRVRVRVRVRMRVRVRVRVRMRVRVRVRVRVRGRDWGTGMVRQRMQRWKGTGRRMMRQLETERGIGRQKERCRSKALWCLYGSKLKRREWRDR